jgi:hypothetical protein
LRRRSAPRNDKNNDSERGQQHDCIFDIDFTGRPGHDRGVGGVFVSAEIIQFIRPDRKSGLTDFPTIAFRSAAVRKRRRWNLEMPKTLTEIRSLARSHTRHALNVLVAVMRNTKVPPPARIAAANAILDRGWGKATQTIETGEDGALELIHRIERVIVHPENPDS